MNIFSIPSLFFLRVSQATLTALRWTERQRGEVKGVTVGGREGGTENRRIGENVSV